MTGETFPIVWNALTDTPAEALNMRLRSDMMIALSDYINDSGLTQAEAAKRLGITQPRVSDLMRGKIGLFSLDTLVIMLAAAGLHVQMSIKAA